MNGKNCDFWRYFFGRVVRFTFNVPREVTGDFFSKNLRRFYHNLWTLSKINLACWRENFIVFVRLVRNCPAFVKKTGSSKLNSTRPWVRCEVIISFLAVKFDWGLKSGGTGTFGRYAKTAFNVSSQTFSRRSICFGRYYWISAICFRTW